jgi:2-amino-4-hydroxy-6-hydroxymethyldihydropteridine diphosphokinase
VLRPWLDVDPTAELPEQGPVADLLEHVDQSGLKLRDDLTLEIQ